MAALIRHGSLANSTKSTYAFLAASTTSTRHDIARFKSKKIVPKVPPKLEATRQSLSSKGFLRPQKSYNPPTNVTTIVDNVCKRYDVPTDDSTKLEDMSLRYNVFVDCGNQLQHYVPNSIMHTIETIGDLKKFYEEPVDTTTPLDAMHKMELPKNLHVRLDYHRFHPDSDVMFGGKTAFPKSSTLVTGLKYRKKYPGHRQEDPVLDLLRKA